MIDLENLINGFNVMHDSKYDYSDTEINRMKSEMVVNCPEHGGFTTTPYDHMFKGVQCPRCKEYKYGSKYRAVMTFKFKIRSMKKHVLPNGQSKYSYDKTWYHGINRKVTIICPKHGEFEQTPKLHLNWGHGCPKCAIEYRANKQRSNVSEFIGKSHKVHGDRYDYSKVDYVNKYTDVIIVCKRHGPFRQSPGSHLRGSNCPQCSYDVVADKCRFTLDKFIENSKVKHCDRYDYSKVIYINNKTKVIIICPKHGEFEQTPDSHMSGKGCAKCSNNVKLTNDEFIFRSNLIHDYKYDYSDVEMNGVDNKIMIVCDDCDNTFIQTPSKHMSGRGCPSCARYGFDVNLAAIFYYINIKTDNGPVYKVGITNRDVRERFKNENIEYTEILVIEFEYGIDALNYETLIKSLCKDYQYTGKQIMRSTGVSELYHTDIVEIIHSTEVINACDYHIFMDGKEI